MSPEFAWPKSPAYVERYRVDDLAPVPGAKTKLRAVFVGESPHRDEVAPDSPAERSPFRGVAGREWWAVLARFLKHPIETRPVPPRRVLLEMCAELGIAVMNAVQYPIDPKITLHEGPENAPRFQLGFEKGSGEFGYKTVFKFGASENPVHEAVEDLADRLARFENHPVQLVCLGNDSRWFVEKAVALLPEEAPLFRKPLITIPHPSSWWRNASYRARAVAEIETLLQARRPGARDVELENP